MDIEQQFLAFCQSFGWGCQKCQLWVCICGRSWIFKRLSFFFITFRTLREYFSLLSEKLQHGFQNCIPCLHLKLSEEERFLEEVICLIILSGNWRKNSHICGKNFSARLLPLLRKYPRKQFKERQFYWEKKNIFIAFGRWAFFWFFIEKT